MKIGFIVLAHKNPKQVRRLVEKLQRDRHHIFLHIDRWNSKRSYARMQEALSPLPRVTWLKRYRSYWGRFGLVKATLEGLRLASEQDFDYVFLLSGQDYPLKPLDALVSFLEDHNGKSFMDYHSDLNRLWPPDGLSRVTRWHFNIAIPKTRMRTMLNRVLNGLLNVFMTPRKLSGEFTPYGGSQWWCLHRECIRYLVRFWQENPGFTDFFEYVHIPDEIFFQTALLNSPLSGSIENRLLTYVDWNGPPYPRLLSEADFDLLQTTQHFFARKFDMEYDGTVLDKIDEFLLR